MDEYRFSVQLLPGIAQIASEREQAGQQPDNLCGPYWISILLRANGFRVTAEQIAQLAGSVLPVGDPANWLPLGATSRQDYCLPLPTTNRLSDAGTSAQGLMHAVTKISQGAYTLLPLQTNWTADRLLTLIQICQNHPHWSAIPLCNLRTGHLWGSHLSIGEAIAYLNGQLIQPPVADWNVGHFLTLAGIVTGRGNDLLWVNDTYPVFGWHGYHLQPAIAVAQALNRDDGYQGGILLFIATQLRDAVESIVANAGFHVAAWDNGSPG